MQPSQDFPPLDVALVESTPFPLFSRWVLEAVEAQVPEPYAMTLATCTQEGHPSARIVLLRGFDERGFCFFTNYQSRKGRELAANPRAALTILWASFQRQIRVEGAVEQVTAQESDEYFRSRPFGHRLSALVSPQSQVVPDRPYLEQRMNALLEQYQDGEEVPRPEHWGGYRVIPSHVEFWQGRANRLHDRIFYQLQTDGSWRRERLAP